MPFKRKSPEHTVLRLVEYLSAFDDAPEAHVLPAPDREFVEERNGVAALYRGEQSEIARIQVLIAAPPVARVVDCVFRFGNAIWIAWIDSPEVRQKRDEATPSLIDTVAYAVCAIDFSPRENLVR